MVTPATSIDSGNCGMPAGPSSSVSADGRGRRSMCTSGTASRLTSSRRASRAPGRQTTRACGTDSHTPSRSAMDRPASTVSPNKVPEMRSSRTVVVSSLSAPSSQPASRRCPAALSR